MIENIDDNFGLMMTQLRAWNALENTLVIFMTDNGMSMPWIQRNGEKTPPHNAGLRGAKNSPDEGGTHVPAFWRWKGVLGEGVDIPALTAHIDLFRTFCELAGVGIPDGIQKLDGRSLVPLLQNSKADWADRHLFVHQGRWAKGADPETHKFKSCAVRSQRWRFVGNKELYDIANDPYESKDVAAEQPEVVEQLRKAYDQWWSDTVPLMVNEDAPYAPHQPQAVRYEKQLKEGGIPAWKPPKL